MVHPEDSNCPVSRACAYLYSTVVPLAPCSSFPSFFRLPGYVRYVPVLPRPSPTLTLYLRICSGLWWARDGRPAASRDEEHPPKKGITSAAVSTLTQIRAEQAAGHRI